MKPDFLYPKIRLQCPTVPSVVMDTYIVDVVRQVCTQTMANVEYVTVPIEAGDARYNLDVVLDSYSASSQSEEVFGTRNKKAVFEDEDGHTSVVLPISEDELDSKVTRLRSDKGTPQCYLFDIDPGRLRLYPAPTKGGELRDLLVVVRPRRDVLSVSRAMAVPDRIYEDYEELVVMGVVANLMRIPKMPWSNFTVGHRFYKDYVSDLNASRREIRSSYSRTIRRINLPQMT